MYQAIASRYGMYRFELYRLVDAPLTRSCNPYLLVAVTLMSVPVVVWLRRQTLLAAIDGGGARPEQDSGSKLSPECAHGCTCRGRQIERWMRMESLRRERIMTPLAYFASPQLAFPVTHMIPAKMGR